MMMTRSCDCLVLECDDGQCFVTTISLPDYVYVVSPRLVCRFRSADYPPQVNSEIKVLPKLENILIINKT